MRWTQGKQPAVCPGQIWQECDNRHPRLIEIVLISESPTEDWRLMIRNIENGRVTYAKGSRFNGKHGGYKFIASSKAKLKNVQLQGSHGRFAK